uniref:CID domain-containing protein n=1 Tax=Meleagris gallopavo TaxID=9103 RepID=A0A803YJ19_MELGA
MKSYSLCLHDCKTLLSELSNSQQSVQTLSLWLIHHRKHTALIVGVWEQDLRKMFIKHLSRNFSLT